MQEGVFEIGEEVHKEDITEGPSKRSKELRYTLEHSCTTMRVIELSGPVCKEFHAAR